jgi:hypothetical protein
MKLTVENFQIHQKPKTVEIPEGAKFGVLRKKQGLNARYLE